jgi:cyclase
MLRNRVIPFLLSRNGGLVKTTRFEKPVYVGDPINAIRIFNEKEVDELALLDITASSDGNGPNFQLVREIASECFMPLSYGGGIRGAEDARLLFSLGVEKVIVRTLAMTSFEPISSIAKFAGSSSVALSLDIKRTRLGKPRIYCPGTPLHGYTDWPKIIRQAIDSGVGEIVLNSVDRDGTMSGVDTDLVQEAAANCSVPIVAVGGVGSLSDIKTAVESGADAVGAGAFFVFHGPRRAVLITYPEYNSLTELLGSKE